MRPVAVDIAIGPEPMRGTLIVDRFSFGGEEPNVNIVTRYPESAFFPILTTLLS